VSEALAKKLADYTNKGYIIAPAGYGKTHLIALAVKEASSQQLILTHTFAGVNSIKTKMAILGIPSSKYQIDTIASWTLKLCLAYPSSSRWQVDRPEGKQWNQLYDSCGDLLKKEFIRHIISSTYSGMYVDEYQDCSQIQHSLVSTLSEFLPCRILGDPLQAIFDFADPPVDWDLCVYPHFECLGELDIPWRWYKEDAHELGDWLKEVREILVSGKKIKFNKKLPNGVSKVNVDLNDYKNPKRHKLFYDFLKLDKDTVIAIHAGDPRSKHKTHKLAQNLAGKFSSIEEVEGRDLFVFFKKYDLAKTEAQAFQLVLDFSKKCFTGVDKTLSAGTKRCEITKKTKTTKYPDILCSANSYLHDQTSKTLRDFFKLLKNNPKTNTYRRDLLNRFMNVLKIHIDGDAANLLEAAHLYQKDFRHSGRPIRHTKQIATTLLVKGLEYDHAIILDADLLGLKELYVALTRGSRSITIISSSDELPV